MNQLRPGRTGRRWNRLRENLKAQRKPCWLCNQPIDYRLKWPHGGSFSADHVAPLSTHKYLAEDPQNLRAAHLRCNTSRGANAPKNELGQTSRQW